MSSLTSVVCLLASVLFGCAALCASSVFAAEAVDLAGVVDLHAHSAPDVVARSANSFAVVLTAKEAGLRADVITMGMILHD